jgi:GTP-binding protein
MFIDLVKIKCQSGKGGDGIVAFRREKYVPKGGPAGGDGGRGGHIIFVGHEGLSTLLDLHYKKQFKAPQGENGMPKKMHGKGGSDMIIPVPVGTTIFDHKSNKVLADITEHEQEVILLKGGRGGRGNVKFATSRNTAPEIAEKGEPGESLELRLELKLLADVGLIGLPSVGKSTLISSISQARPKIADYPFTTLQPNLGVVGVPDGRSFVAADLPGLIEGASLGAGLGLQFLRHIERTRVLIHVIDMGAVEGRNPYEDYHIIMNELAAYGHRLTERPMIIAANKMDVPEAQENLEAFKAQLKDDIPIIPISAATQNNMDALLYQTADVLGAAPKFDVYGAEDYTDHMFYRFDDTEDKAFDIQLGDDGIYEVEGYQLRKMFEMTDFSTDQSVKRFSRQLRSLGVDDALRKLGVKDGQTVRLCGLEFEFVD